MKLSKRLERVAGMVTEGNRLADIGTDHAFVPIYLCENKRIPSAIAIDINSGPLERAREHIAEAGLSAYIETRLSNGTTKLEPGEADTLLLAGMGGLLMERILGDRDVVRLGIQELVLQPQSDITDLRQWIQIQGWQIVCEDIVYEGGKYYPMMKAVQGPYISYTIEEYHYGRLDLQQSLPVLEKYMEKHLRTEEEILESVLSYGKDKLTARVEFAQRSIRQIQKALDACRDALKQRGYSSQEEGKSAVTSGKGRGCGPDDKMPGLD